MSNPYISPPKLFGLSKFFFLLLFLFFFSTSFANTVFGPRYVIAIPDHEKVRFEVLSYDYDGQDDRSFGTHMSIQLDGSEHRLVHFYTDHNKHDAFFDKYSHSKYGAVKQISSKKKGDHYYRCYEWYYPPELRGREVKFRFHGKWVMNAYFTWSREEKFDFIHKVTIPEYDPKVTLNIDPHSNGDFLFTWDQGAKMTLFSFFLNHEDGTQSHIDDAYTSAGEMQLPASKFHTLDKKNQVTYTVKYETPRVDGIQYTHVSQERVVEHDGFRSPIIHEIPSFDPCSKSVVINWSVNNNHVNTGGGDWLIHRKSKDEADNLFQQITSIPHDGSSNMSYMDEGEGIDYDSPYIYRISYKPTQFTDAIFSPGLFLDREVWSNRLQVDFSSLDITTQKRVDTKPCAVNLSWEPSWCDGSRVFIIRQDSLLGTTDTIEVEDPYSGVYSDLGDKVQENRFYYYSLLVDNYGLYARSNPQLVIIEDAVKFVEDGFITTKGVKADRVSLEWKIDRLDLCDRFEIYRRIADDNSDELGVLVHRFRPNDIYNAWDDTEVEPGLLYQYTIMAEDERPDKSKKRVYTKKREGIGFAQPLASVAGRITYNNGTAVSNATVHVKTNEKEEQRFKSIYFGAKPTQRAMAQLKKSHNKSLQENFTWQAWVKPLATQSQSTIFQVDSLFRIAFEDTSIKVYWGHDESQVLHHPLKGEVHQYTHLSLVLDSSSKLTLYQDGEHATSLVISGTVADKQEGYKLSMGNNLEYYLPFFGNIDEMRLWKCALSKEEIEANLDRYLTGGEEDLIGYWQMDEGMDNYVFDRSHKSKVYHEHHFYLVEAKSSDIIPAYRQLSIKGTTDKNGNYLIMGIPYHGDGTAYEIVPDYNLHTFEPSSQLRFLSESSEVQNETNFKDISSFPVKGRIVYEHTDYPVDGVSFSVDGNICSKDGDIIYSDQDGYFEIDVPIGKHFIEINKQGHTFKNGGRYPQSGKAEFLMPMTVNFVDETKVTIVGRVAGGDIEAGKSIGFGRGKANIGSATLTLTPLRNKEAKIDTMAGSLLTGNQYINSELSSVEDRNELLVKTDSRNGEFIFEVAPIPFKIEDITTNNKKVKYDLSTLPLIDINPMVTDYDTIYNEMSEQTDTCFFHKRLDLIYYVESPDFSLTDNAYDYPGAFGDTIYTYLNKEGEELELPLFERKEDKITYSLGKPVFTQGKRYEFAVKAFEVYENCDDTENVIIDRVPLSNASVVFNNEIGRGIVPLDKNQPDSPNSDDIEVEPNEVILDEKGEGIYVFGGGIPNLGTSSHTLALEASLEYDDISKPCLIDGDKSLTAVVLGDMPTGQSFVTRGPDKVINILRDPPGSNSTAYIEKGSSFSSSVTYAGRVNSNIAVKTTTKFGVKLETVNGIGLAIVNEIDSKYDLGIGFEEESVKAWGETVSSTVSSSERIATSDDPDYVGYEGDVYIGNSTNLFFGLSNRLLIDEAVDGDIIIDGKKYALKINPGYVANIESETGFKYTHKHIVDKMIPELQKMRNAFIRQVDPSEYDHYVNPFDSVVYISKIPENDPLFGTLENYRAIPPQRSTDHNVDTVNWFNAQISSWESIIRQNDSIKHAAFSKNGDGLFKKSNTSFDAGTSIEYSKTFTNDVVSFVNEEFTMQVVNTHDGGVIWNNTGVLVESELKLGGGFDESTETGTTHETTYGYTLLDGDAHNFYSIDIYEPLKESIHGFIFKTIGGQTSCPYEGHAVSDYYLADGAPLELAVATMQVEKPSLRVEESLKVNVPTGKEAVYNLKLNNISETESPNWYTLYVIDDSNPNGAILSIDGSVLTEGRLFQVQSRQELLKTLSLKQSRLDVLEYDDIQIVLASQCDFQNVADTISISAHFVASCSDVELHASHTLVNTSSQTKIDFVIDEYNLEYKNFAGIHLQYKEVDSEDWLRIKEYVNDSDKIPPTADNELIDGRTRLEYTFDMAPEIDQDYEFRAVTLCMNGNEVVKYEGAPILVHKDMSAPTVLSRPSPVNGILTPETELSIVFNEEIQSNKITRSNFDIKGLLNGYRLQDNVGVSFDKKHSLYSELPISMQGSSFTLEMWVKPLESPQGVLFSWGEGENRISVRLIDSQNLELLVGNKSQKIELNKTIPTAWTYWSMSYDHINQTMAIQCLTDNDGEDITIDEIPLAKRLSVSGRITIGNDDKLTNGFKGHIREVSLWNKVRYMADIASDINQSKHENVQNLQCYWILDEGEGIYARDKIQGRNLMVKANWYINPRGRAVEFNGLNHLQVKTGHLPFNNKSSYTIEFWFKGDTQTNATLFSCGKGQGDSDVKNKLSLRFNQQSQLEMLYADKVSTIAEETLLDNQWHHLALSVQRGNIAHIYIDGMHQAQVPLFGQSALMATNYTLGMCRYTEDGHTWLEDEHFVGSMDELRVWNTDLTVEHIRLYKNNMVEAQEDALVAYYPFETHTKNEYDQWVVKETLADLSINQIGKATGEVAFHDETPVIKLIKPLEDVSFSWVASKNQITIKLDDPIERIENCVIELSVEGVLDTKGNKMLSPVKWSAFVDLNRLKWDTEEIVLAKEVESALQFKVYASNSGGVAEEFRIENVPYWMKISPMEGVLNPLSKQEFEVTVDPAVNIGKYDHALALIGNNHIREVLPVKLSVTGMKPDWEVNPSDFEYSMNMTGQIKIEGQYQEDVDDLIGVFDQDRCVGIAQPRYVRERGAYMLFVDIYGNGDMDGHPLSFKLWDASTGYVYPEMEISQEVAFTPSVIVGSIDRPVILNAIDNIQQAVNLSKGWNWIAVHVNNKLGIFDQYKEQVGPNGIIVKSQAQFSQYENGGWYGPLRELDNDKMYLMSVAENQNILLHGRRVTPEEVPIHIEGGWNWIAYVPQFILPLNEALAGHTATDGDQIKGQVGFATYVNEIGWVGSLDYLQPGKGYMYNSFASAEMQFTYPNTYYKKANAPKLTSKEYEPYWDVESTKYPNNSTITLSLTLNNRDVTEEGIEIAAFVGDECRGSSFVGYEGSLDNYLSYLMVYGETGDEIRFKAYDHKSGQVYNYCDSVCIFKYNNTVGSPLEPYHIGISSELVGMEDLEDSFILYPALVKDKIHIKKNKHVDSYTIYDSFGRLLQQADYPADDMIDVSQLPDGTYLLILESENRQIQKRFVKIGS